jgi:cytochrome c oxidase subunit 1
MSTNSNPALPQAPQGFIRKYVFSTDHKVIGLQYLFTGMLFLLLGGLLAMLIRWQLGFPGKALPGMGSIASTGMPGGHMLPDFYHMLFTMHATIMIFFAVIPMLVGGFGNYVVPLMIGAEDMAFPKLNAASYWTYFVSGIVMLASFTVAGGAAKAGWFAYAPLSVIDSQGMTYWIISLIILGASSIMGSINFITTILNLRAPGMTMFRLPLTVWSIFITSILLLLALPSLTVAVACLLMDRVAGTSFFMPAGLLINGTTLDRSGGQPLLWQHLFWFFGHPEVYIVIMPAMGIVSDLISSFSRRPLFGYRMMVYSLLGIASLSFVVWGHHMFVSGMNPMLGTTFMMSTMIIALPSAIKTFNWLGTMWRGSIRFKPAMWCAVGFISMFIIGGLTGVFLASTPVDIYVHNTYFVIGHFHFMMVGGALFGIFGGLYYWYPKMFGRMMNDNLGSLHVILTFIFFNLLFYPMFILGVAGEPRRLFDVAIYPSLEAMQPIRAFMSINAFLLFGTQLLFLVNFFGSLIKGRKAEKNPWEANTLEWTTSSPPPFYNYEKVPTVYRGPYEYSVPQQRSDWVPQNQPS